MQRSRASRRRSVSLACALLASIALVVACGDKAGGDPPPPQGDTPVKAVPVRVVRSYPHDPRAFTQGLVFRNGELLESTGRFGESSLRRVKIETGEVQQRVDVPKEFFAEGLAVLGDRAYQLTWQNGQGFIYDVNTFQKVGTFPYEGEGWGLTTDGTSLILSDGTAVIRFLDPKTFQVTRSIEVRNGNDPVDQLNELEWVRGEIWANVWHKDWIARIDPKDGHVIGWLDVGQLLPEATAADQEAVPNGIAFDAASGRLFVTGKLWSRMFEITAPELQAAGATNVR